MSARDIVAGGGLSASIAVLLILIGCQNSTGSENANVADTTPAESVRPTGDTPPIDCDPSAPIPDRPVSGWIQGRQFAAEQSEIQNGILKIRQGEEFFADLQMLVFTFVDHDELAPGLAIEVDHGQTSATHTPHIHIGWKAPEGDLPETAVYMDDYVMRLEFGEQIGQKRQGKIYACMGNSPRTLIQGTFEADIH